MQQRNCLTKRLFLLAHKYINKKVLHIHARPRNKGKENTIANFTVQLRMPSFTFAFAIVLVGVRVQV